MIICLVDEKTGIEKLVLLLIEGVAKKTHVKSSIRLHVVRIIQSSALAEGDPADNGVRTLMSDYSIIICESNEIVPAPRNPPAHIFRCETGSVRVASI